MQRGTPIRPALRLPGRSDEAISEADRTLLAAVDGAFEEAARRAGSRLACGPGCHSCCVGTFPITRLDAWRLRRGLALLAGREPRRAAGLLRRAEAAAEALSAGFPGDPITGRLDDDEAGQDRYHAAHSDLPCPALDPGTGLCDLYDARPVSCRTFGPPVGFGAEKAPPCGLCFQGAEPAEIETCRVEPDPTDIEEAILSALARGHGQEWETLVAFAVVRGEP